MPVSATRILLYPRICKCAILDVFCNLARAITFLPILRVRRSWWTGHSPLVGRQTVPGNLAKEVEGKHHSNPGVFCKGLGIFWSYCTNPGSGYLLHQHLTPPTYWASAHCSKVSNRTFLSGKLPVPNCQNMSAIPLSLMG